jgi:hypothetical protein
MRRKLLVPKVPKCHPENPYRSHGLCVQCVYKLRTLNQIEAHREASRRYYNSKKLIDKLKPFEHVARNLLKYAKIRATKKNLPFNLELEDIHVPEVCPILGIPLSQNEGRNDDKSFSLDRIDNTKGYVKGNVIVISLRANRIKSDSTLDELTKLVEFYREQSRN